MKYQFGRNTLFALALSSGCASGASRPSAQPQPQPQQQSASQKPQASPKTLAEMFEGKFAGVSVTPVPGGVKLCIRNAQNSDGTPAYPLYVIDGLPIQPPDGVLSMNPDDVLKIEILKDDASTQIWGQQAANGVVKITTKRK